MRRHHTGTFDLVLYSETATFHVVDVPGQSIGDQQIFTDRLTTDAAKTNRVGLDRVIAESDTLAIVGGTGQFENASGSVHLSIFDSTTFLNELHFTT